MTRETIGMIGDVDLADAGTAGTTGSGIGRTTGTGEGTDTTIGIGIEIGETATMIATDLEAVTETEGIETDTEIAATIATQIAVDHAKTGIKTRTRTKPTRNQLQHRQNPLLLPVENA